MPDVRRLPSMRSLLLTSAAVLVAAQLAGAGVARAEPGASDIVPGDTVVGELVQAWPEQQDPATAAEHANEGPLTWVETPDGEAVRIPTDAIEDVARAEVGATVEVVLGEEVADGAATEEGLEPAREVLEATVVEAAPADPPPPTAAAGTLTNSVTVVMAVPSGAVADTRTLTEVVDMVNGPVAAFWSGQSDGTVRIGVTVHEDRRSTPLTASCADPLGIFEEVRTLVGWTSGAGKHLLVHLPAGASGCSDGLATIGSSLTSGGRLYTRSVVPSVTAHELGHNFGLGHASERQCDRAMESGTCVLTEYNDWYDLMGFSWSEMGTLNAPHAARLGLLPAAERIALTPTSASAGFVLAPISAAGGTRAVRLADAGGAVYWLEYRQASGQDIWLGSATRNSPGLDQGVTLRRAADGPYDTSLLLDATPSAQRDWNGDRRVALPLNSPVPVAGGTYTVTVTAADSGGAQVYVRVGSDPIDVRYRQLGGAGGPLGSRVGSSFCGLHSGGCYQGYQFGSIYWSPATGAHVLRGAIRDLWNLTGAQDGWLGYPVTDELCGLRGGGCVNYFQYGSIFWSPATGARVVNTVLMGKWQELGWEAGVVGYPLTNVACGLAGNGCTAVFQGGSLFWSPATGTHFLRGAIRDLWNATGAQDGWLGYPVTDEICQLRGGGCLTHFGNGSVYWSPTTGTHAVTDAIRATWAASGWEAGGWGYPTGDALPVNGGVAQRFQGGTATWNSTTGAVTIR